MPLVRGSSWFEKLNLSHHSRLNVAREWNPEEIHDDDDGPLSLVLEGNNKKKQEEEERTTNPSTTPSDVELNLRLD